MSDVPRVDQPYQRNESSNEKIHESFFFNDPKFVSIDVFMSDTFNEDSHDCGKKEKSNRIFQHITKLIAHTCFTELIVNQMVNDVWQNELVEENQANQGDKYDYPCVSVVWMLDEGWLPVEQEVEADWQSC